MFRLLCRELAISLGALAALTTAGVALADGFGRPAIPDLHPLRLALSGGQVQWDEALPAAGASARLICYAFLALLAGLIIVRIFVAVLLLLRLDYAPLSHLAVALRLPVARRAGATAVVGLLLAPVGAIARDQRVVNPSLPQFRITALRRPPGQGDGETPPRAHPRRRTRPHSKVHRLAGPALRYTVQPGDTLSLVAERLCGDARRYVDIYQASRFLRQPDGRYLSNPNLIYPGWTLLVPLRVVTALSVSEEHVIYVVQPGDSLSAIAARFLGDWRRYPELQPQGTTIADANLIYPGLVLRLPASAVVMPIKIPVRLRRINPHAFSAKRPVRRRSVRTLRMAGPTHPQQETRLLPRPTPMPRMKPPTGTIPRHRVRTRHKVQTGRRAIVRPVSRHVTNQPRPRRRLPRRAPLRPARVATAAATAAPTMQPVPARVARQTLPVQQRPTAVVPTGLPTPTRSIRLPDASRQWPLALLLALAPVFMFVALKRRRTGSTNTKAMATPSGRPPVPSMRSAITAIRGGIQGRLAKAIDAGIKVGDVNLVAPVAIALDEVGAAMARPTCLARSVLTASETSDTLTVLLEVQHVADDACSTLATALENKLGTSVRAEQVADRDGVSCIEVTVKRGPLLTALGSQSPKAALPPPVPLLMPLGQDATGTVIYVNLEQIGALLIAARTRGTNTLVATLLAGILAQADPALLRLLASSNDDELRGMLPILEHLEAPPADAQDVSAAAAIVEQAHQIVLDRFATGDANIDEPAYLVLLDNIEELRPDAEALDRLDTLCRNGRVCGVHILATTSDVGAVAELGLLEPFRSLLARPLPADEHSLLFGDNAVGTPGADEIALRIGRTGDLQRLVPFTLTLPEVREVVATVAVALAPDDLPDLDAPAPTLDAAANDAGVATQRGADVVQDAAPLAEPDAQGMRSADPAGEAATVVGGGAETSLQGSAECTVASGSEQIEITPATSAAPISGPDTDGMTAAAEHGTYRQWLVGRDRRVKATGRATPSIEIRVLGGIDILLDGHPVALKPREQRLLAALAVMGPTPVRPDRLVEALFPDDDALSGQDKLQHSITAVRLCLKKAGLPVKRAGVVRYSMTGYDLDPALVRVDAHLFREALRQSETAEGAERRRLLAQAVDLYQGDLCGDQSIEWVEGYRYAWRKEYLEALYELAVWYEQGAKDTLAALRVARRLVGEEPLNDHYHQMVLELIAATGDLDALDRCYAEVQEVFAEYATEVDGFTGTLYERLRTQVVRERPAPDGSETNAD